MSVSSLTNNDLYLTTLGVNNSQYSDVSGYIPKQVVISGTKNTAYLNVPDGVSIGGTLQLTNGSNAVNISNTGLSNITVGGSLTTTGGIGISNGNILQLANTAGNNFVNISNSGASNVLIAGSLTTDGDVTISGGDINLGITPNNVLLSGTAGTLGITGQLRLTAGSGTGVLSVNASNQLLWNGVVIS
jgi:hypothetical protein